MGIPILENWTDIEGEIMAVEPDHALPGFSLVPILLRAVERVEEFPNFLEGAEGSEVAVHFPEDAIEEHAMRPGRSIACRVRRAGVHQYFVHREHISVGDEEEPSERSRDDR